MRSVERTGEAGRILIVEDEPLIASDLTHRLEAMGFDVVGTVRSAESAIVEAASLLPDVVLYDHLVRGAIPHEQAIADIRELTGAAVVSIFPATDPGALSPGDDTPGHILLPFNDREIRSTLELTLHRSRSRALLNEAIASLDTVLRETADAYVLLERSSAPAGSTPPLTILKVNPAFESLTGKNRSVLTGTEVRDLFPEQEPFWEKICYEGTGEESSDPAALTLEFNGRKLGVSFWKPVRRQRALLLHLAPPAGEAGRRAETDHAVRTSVFLRNILDSSSRLSIVSTDTRGIVEFWNSGAERLFGYTADEMVGKVPISVLYPPGNAETRAGVLEIQHEVMGRLRTVTREMQEVRKDGTAIWVRVTVSPRLDPSGTICGLLGIGEDITARKQLEADAARSREMLESILGSMSDVVCAFSVDGGTLLLVNDAAAALYGISLHALRKNPRFWLDAALPDDRGPLERAMQEVLQAGAGAWTYRIQRPGGEVRWVRDRRRLIRDRSGEPERIDCLLSDITQEKQSEAELQSSLREKELLLKEIHHRVKNNLTTVASLLSLQEQYGQGKETGEILREAISRIRSMGLIHERLYQSTRLAEIDGAEYVRSLAAELVRVYGKGNITLEVAAVPIPFDIDTAIPCGLILNELVTNAIKYAFPDSRRGVVRIGLSVLPPSGFVLAVSDNGVGLPSGHGSGVSGIARPEPGASVESAAGGSVEFTSGRGLTVRLTVESRRKKSR